MKRYALFFCAAAAALLAGCSFFPVVEGSGVLRTARHAETGFTRIAASQSFKVHVVPDAVYSVSITCDDNIVPFVVVRPNGADSLLISLAPGNSYFNVTLRAEVHMPTLRGLDLSGAAEADVAPGFSSSSGLDVTASGAGIARVGTLTCPTLSAELSWASSLTFSGMAARLTLRLSGASHADMLGCASTEADVSLSGASDAKVNVGTGVLTVNASGASTLYYEGSPSLRLNDLSGASRVVRIQ